MRRQEVKRLVARCAKRNLCPRGNSCTGGTAHDAERLFIPLVLPNARLKCRRTAARPRRAWSIASRMFRLREQRPREVVSLFRLEILPRQKQDARTRKNLSIPVRAAVNSFTLLQKSPEPRRTKPRCRPYKIPRRLPSSDKFIVDLSS